MRGLATFLPGAPLLPEAAVRRRGDPVMLSSQAARVCFPPRPCGQRGPACEPSTTSSDSRRGMGSASSSSRNCTRRGEARRGAAQPSQTPFAEGMCSPQTVTRVTQSPGGAGPMRSPMWSPLAGCFTPLGATPQLSRSPGSCRGSGSTPLSSFHGTPGGGPTPISWEEVASARRRRVRLRWTPASVYEITPYAEVYGRHPSIFDFDASGDMIQDSFSPQVDAVVPAGLEACPGDSQMRSARLAR